MRHILVLLIFLAPASVLAQRIPADQILANLQYRIPELRNQEVAFGPFSPSAIDGLERGSFTVNGERTYTFLLASDPPRIALLIGDPIDISLSSDEIAELVALESEQEATLAAERHGALLRFAAGLPSRGPADAPVTIFEFSDFQCPFCARGRQVIDQVLAKYPEDVRFVYLHLPLGIHDWAMDAAVAATCAEAQSHEAFWVLHDFFFDNQRTLDKASLLARTRAALDGTGLDLGLWDACVGDEESAANQMAALKVNAAIDTAGRYGITGTPAFFVNGTYFSGVRPLSDFESVIARMRGESPEN